MSVSSRSESVPPPISVAHRVLAMGIITAATLVVYRNSFPGTFVFDDVSSITENLSIRNLWPLGPLLTPPSEAGVGGRPLANLTFALNYSMGGLNASRFHAFNLGLHVATALMLFGVVRRTLLQPQMRAICGVASVPVAMSAALIWSVHPLTTGVVNYTSQRTELMMALCCLITIYSLTRAVQSGDRRWQILGVAACAAGMASKEVMVTAPLLTLLYDRVFLAGSWSGALRSRPWFYGGLAGTWILLGWLIVSSAVAARGVGFDLGVGWSDYGLTQGRAVLHYLRLAIWPDPLVFDYGWAFVGSIGEGIPHLVATLALAVASVIALRRCAPLGFAGCVVFLILSPTSSVIPIVQQPIAESRMYLPLAALVATGCSGVAVALRSLSVIPLVLAMIGFGWLTTQRNTVYQSEVMIWSDTVAKQPGNARAHANLSAAQIRANRLPEAIAAAEVATRLMPRYANAHHNLALALVRSGRLAEGIARYEIALQRQPNSADTHYNLGEAMIQAGKTDGARAHLEEAIRLNPRHNRAHNNLSVVLLEIGRVVDAAQHSRSALQIDPEFADAHYNLGNALARMGDHFAAISSYEAALRLRPSFTKAHNNLGILQLQTGDVGAAIRHFESALQIDPDYEHARRNLELAKIPRK